MVNRIVLIGRLTRDPELRVTNSGKSVCDFTIAVQKRVRPQDNTPDADFFRIITWEKSAEYVSNYLSKGRLVAVDGRLQSRKYTAADGSNREAIEIIADSVHSLDRPREDTGTEVKMPASAAVGAGTAPKVDEYDPFAEE